jgi:hypothetical protein
MAGLVIAAGCGGGSKAPACQSIDSFCAAQSTACIRDWALAAQPSTWCSRQADGGATGPNNESVFIQADCDGFNFVYLVGLDNGMYFYYDPKGGQLVGVGGAVGSPDGKFCIAGVAPASPPGVLCGDAGATKVCGPTS